MKIKVGTVFVVVVVTVFKKVVGGQGGRRQLTAVKPHFQKHSWKSWL